MLEEVNWRRKGFENSAETEPYFIAKLAHFVIVAIVDTRERYLFTRFA